MSELSTSMQTESARSTAATIDTTEFVTDAREPLGLCCYDLCLVFGKGSGERSVVHEARDKTVTLKEADRFRQRRTQVTQALQKKGFICRLVSSSDIDFLLIHATDKLLRKHAQRNRLPVLLEPDSLRRALLERKDPLALCAAETEELLRKGQLCGRYSRFESKLATLFNDMHAPYCQQLEELQLLSRTADVRTGEPSCFSAFQRHQLVCTATKALSLDGKKVEMSALLDDDKEPLKTVFPVPNLQHRALLRQQVALPKHLTDCVLAACGWTRARERVHSSMLKIRDYIGESWAYYFAFVSCLIGHMVLPVGMALLLTMSSASVVEGSFAYLCFACCVPCAAFLFLRRWNRQSERLRQATAFSHTPMDMRRRGFRAHHFYSPVDGLLRSYMPRAESRKRRVVSGVATLAALLVSLCAATFLFFLRARWEKSDWRWAKPALTVVSTTQTTLLTLLGANLVPLLVQYENHAYKRQHQASFTLKWFLLRFIVAFQAPLFVAFVRRVLTGCENNSCMPLLRQEVFTLFVTQILVQNVVEIAAPFVMSKVRAWRQKNKVSTTAMTDDTNAPGVPNFSGVPNPSRARAPDEASLAFEDMTRDDEEIARILLSELQKETQDSPFEDIGELVLHFGLMFLFASAAPVALSALAFVAAVAEFCLDWNKVTLVLRRPSLRRSGGIGRWSVVFATLGMLSMPCNVMLVLRESFWAQKLVEQYASPASVALRIAALECLLVLLYYQYAYKSGLHSEIDEKNQRNRHVLHALALPQLANYAHE
ncbi:MAG: hypothetical protein MHM6MM_001680 [Cercozoa sp. M6MM]